MRTCYNYHGEGWETFGIMNAEVATTGLFKRAPSFPVISSCKILPVSYLGQQLNLLEHTEEHLLSFQFREPQRTLPVINTPQAGKKKLKLYSSIWDFMPGGGGMEDILVLREAALVSSAVKTVRPVHLNWSKWSSKVVPHPCRVSCYFHFFCLLSHGNCLIISLFGRWKTWECWVYGLFLDCF